MIIYGNFPLRISLAGGGTDLEPYVTDCGGHVVNFGINKFIEIQLIDKENLEKSITIRNKDTNRQIEVVLTDLQKFDDHDFRIPIACLLSFKKIYPTLPIDNFIIQYSSDVKMGSGLGGSSILAAGLISTLNMKYHTNLSASEIVSISKFAESRILNLKGGLQDYWSACNSNLKSLIFKQNGDTTIREIPLNSVLKDHLRKSLLMLNTNVSRISGDIIEDQMKSMRNNRDISYNHLDKLKMSAELCEKVLRDNESLDQIGNIFNVSWESKKALSTKASIIEIDTLRSNLISLGAIGAKICGAGGGGFLLIQLDTKRNLDGLFSYIDHFNWEYVDLYFQGPRFVSRNA